MKTLTFHRFFIDGHSQEENLSDLKESKEEVSDVRSEEVYRPDAEETKKQVIKFVLFSASAGVIETVTFTLLDQLTGWKYWPCYLIALILSVLWNFTLNREFTFKSANNVPLAMFKVFCFYCVFTPLSTWWGNALTEYVGWNDYAVLALTMAANLTSEYLYDRYFVYRNSMNTNERGRRDLERRNRRDREE